MDLGSSPFGDTGVLGSGDGGFNLADLVADDWLAPTGDAGACCLAGSIPIACPLWNLWLAARVCCTPCQNQQGGHNRLCDLLW